MRNSGWAAAGLGSLVLLLAACGGSSSSTSAYSPTSQSTASSSAATTPATGTKNKQAAAASTPKPHNTAGPQPSSNVGESIPAVGTTIITVRNSNIGYVLAEASGYVVYTYAKDSKGGTSACTGSCAMIWVPVTGVPQVSQGVTLPGTLGLVTRAGGVKQITYNGYPLYIYEPAGPLVTTGNGKDGLWHVVKMSGSDITG